MASNASLLSKLSPASRAAIGAVALTSTSYATYRYFNPTRIASFDSPNAGKERPKTFNGGWFKPLKLHSVEEVSHNVKKFRFELPEKEAVSGLQPCSALLTWTSPPGSWLPVIRPYTPISDPDEPGYVTLMIKRYDRGKASSYIHSLSPGDTISARGPLPTYPWTPNQHSHVVLIAGGAGVTPMYQLAKTILRNPQDKTKVTLIFGNNTENDVLCREDFDEWSRTRPDQFKVAYIVSHTKPNSEYEQGYITKELLKKHVPSAQTPGVKVCISGPPGLEKAMTGQSGFFGGGSHGGILKELGYSKDQVHRF